MTSQPTPNPETQRGLLKVIKALTTMPAQVLFYGSALLAIAATGGVALPGALGVVATSVGVNVLSSILERVALGDEVPDEEIRKSVEEAISNSGIEKLATSNEFQRAIAHVFRQFDLLKYAVQRGEFTIVEKLTDQLSQHKLILDELKDELFSIRVQMDSLATHEQSQEILGKLRHISTQLESLYPTWDATSYEHKIGVRLINDETKDAPSLFSINPVRGNLFNPATWVISKYKLTLWCEHSLLPLPALNGKTSQKGVYEINVYREWFAKINPYLKFVSYVFMYILPVLAVITYLVLDASTFGVIQPQLVAGVVIVGGIILLLNQNIKRLDQRMDKVELLLNQILDAQSFGKTNRAIGGALDEFHNFLKSRDPSFGGLVRVINSKHEFLWVHEKFASEYQNH